MSARRALVLPGLVPLSSSNVRRVLEVPDSHLDLAADECRFDPTTVSVDAPQSLPTVVHEALLAVAVIRRMASEDEPWSAYGGLSAGCLTALHAAGAITERTCFRLIYDISTGHGGVGEREGSGTTLALLALSQGDADQLLKVLDAEGYQPWLSVDLGGGAIAISVPSTCPDGLLELLNQLGVLVLDSIDRAEHCPFALPRVEHLTALLADAEVTTPSTALVSPLTGRRVEPTPAALRAMVVEQSFDTASLPLLLDGLCRVPGVTGVDLISPAQSVYLSRTHELLHGRADHRALPLAG